MAQTNIFRPLKTDKSNFFLFSQFGDDLSKEYTAKDHHIPSSQVIGVQSGGAGRYYAFLQGVVDGGSAAGDSSHFEAGTGQPFSV